MKSQHYTHHYHWADIYRHRRRLHGVSTRSIMVSQFIGLFGSLGAGLILDINKYSISMVAGAILIMPGIVDLSASIGGALSAKINHGTDDSLSNAGRFSIRSLLFSLLVALLAGSLVGAFGGAVGAFFFDASFWQILSLGVSTMMFASLIGFPIVAFVTLAIKKLDLNPDNIVGAIETSLFDTITIVAFSIMVKVLL